MYRSTALTSDHRVIKFEDEEYNKVAADVISFMQSKKDTSSMIIFQDGRVEGVFTGVLDEGEYKIHFIEIDEGEARVYGTYAMEFGHFHRRYQMIK